MEKSDIIFDERVSIETGHGIDRDHTLDGVFGELCFSCFLLRPYNSEGGVELSIPVIGLCDNNTGSFSLHDHGIDEVLEGFLCGDKFFHDDLVDFINPMWDLSLFVLFGTEDSVDGLVDDFLELF